MYIYMYVFYMYIYIYEHRYRVFYLIVFWAGNALAVLKCKPS